jgi:HK97 family phage major capsid protein
MAVSLEQMSRKIGDKRRKVSDLNNQLQASIKSYDEKEDALVSKSESFKPDEKSGELTSEQTAELDTLRGELNSLRLENIKLSDAMQSAKSDLSALESDLKLRQQSNDTENWLTESNGRVDSVLDVESSGGTSDRIRVMPATSEQLDHDLGVLFQCRILSDMDRVPVATIAKETFKNDRVASAAMYAGDHASGGSWIQGVYLDRFIELLRPLSIVRMMGVDTVPLDDGSLLMPKETAGPTGQYLGEKEPANVETLATGDIRLVAKELVCMVAASEKLIRSPSANASTRIRNSVMRGAGQTEDLYFLRGVAAGAGPTGLRYLAAAANILTANGTVNLANVTNDLGRLELALLNSNVVEVNPAWIMAPRTKVYLMDLRDANGNLAWPSLSLPRPMLRGKPVYTTTQIPINLGSGDKSEIMLVEASHLIIGDAPRVGFDSSNVAAYLDGGVMKASFAERKVVTRLVMENDFNTLYDQAIAVMTAVNWGV